MFSEIPASDRWERRREDAPSEPTRCDGGEWLEATSQRPSDVEQTQNLALQAGQLSGETGHRPAATVREVMHLDVLEQIDDAPCRRRLALAIFVVQRQRFDALVLCLTPPSCAAARAGSSPDSGAVDLSDDVPER